MNTRQELAQQTTTEARYTVQMYLPGSRRIKGAGREGQQYEAAMREGTLRVESGSATLPSGVQIFGDGDLLPVAMASAQRDGWETDRELAYISSAAQAIRRDSEPVRHLRRLAKLAGHGGNGLHKLLGVSPVAVAMWRSGQVKMPEEIAAKLPAMIMAYFR